MRPDYFGEPAAATYDDDPEMFAPEAVEPVADFLAALASEGSGAPSALEFGIGTGRIALPLSRRGVRVHGIDLSTTESTATRCAPRPSRSATYGRPSLT